MSHNGRALLQAFLKKHGITKKQAERSLGVSSQAILAWLKGSSSPAFKNRADIETWTAGEVPADAWPPIKQTKRKKKVVVTPYVAA
jgi:transcriptional regulator with XRE-family HTH domain